MGGGGGTSSTVSQPQLPPELRNLYSTVGNSIAGAIRENPISNFSEMDPRQVQGADPLQQKAYDAVGNLFQPSSSLENASSFASRLGNLQPFQGADLSGVPGWGSVSLGGGGGSPGASGAGGAGGAGGNASPRLVPGGGPQPGGNAPAPTGNLTLPGWENYGGGQSAIPGREAPLQLPGRESVAQAENPERIDSALNNIDFANHPALQSALKTFQASTLPGLANQLAAGGITRSGAAGQSVANAKAQIALPVMQQLVGLAVEERNQDIGQRGQDQQFGLTQRGQDINSILQQRGQDISGLLEGRGQDITQRGQDITGGLQQMGYGLQARGQDIGALMEGRGQDLSARGQDINAILSNAGLNLQGRGQDIGALTSGMQGMLGVNEADLGRNLAALGQAGLYGGLMRDIGQQQSDAGYDEQMRQYNMARDLLFAPLGGLTSQVGSRSSTTSNEGK